MHFAKKQNYVQAFVNYTIAQSYFSAGVDNAFFKKSSLDFILL